MKRYTVDSSFVVNILTGEKKALELLENLQTGDILFPSVARMEVRTGKKEIGEFEKLEVVDFDQKASETAVEMREYLENSGEMINTLDIMIAAQSHAADSVLVSSDTDFRSLEGFDNFRHRLVEVKNE